MRREFDPTRVSRAFLFLFLPPLSALTYPGISELKKSLPSSPPPPSRCVPLRRRPFFILLFNRARASYLSSREIQRAFSGMIQYKVKLFVNELISVMLAPIILGVSLPKCADELCEFVRGVKTEVPGAGDGESCVYVARGEKGVCIPNKFATILLHAVKIQHTLRSEANF